jgi:hypothetical protein
MKRALAAFLLLSVIANLYLAYLVFDNGVTITYMDASMDTATQRLATIGKLFPSLVRPVTETELKAAAKNAGLDYFEKPEEHGVLVDQVMFTFSNDHLVGFE